MGNGFQLFFTRWKCWGAGSRTGQLHHRSLYHSIQIQWHCKRCFEPTNDKSWRWQLQLMVSQVLEQWRVTCNLRDHDTETCTLAILDSEQSWFAPHSRRQSAHLVYSQPMVLWTDMYPYIITNTKDEDHRYYLAIMSWVRSGSQDWKEDTFLWIRSELITPEWIRQSINQVDSRQRLETMSKRNFAWIQMAGTAQRG